MLVYDVKGEVWRRVVAVCCVVLVTSKCRGIWVWFVDSRWGWGFVEEDWVGIVCRGV